jgi:sugar lactone lactonase YvrE
MEQATHFLTIGNILGEGATWSPEEQALYWVDITGRRFYRYVLATHHLETFETNEMVGVLALRTTGGLIMATAHGFASWDFRTDRLTPLHDPEAGQNGKRFNDGGIDSQGRFWAGTMDIHEPRTPDGVLYRFDPDGSVHTMDAGFTIPNGLAWSPDDTLMYMTDSPARTIYVYDFDAAGGTISHRRVLIASHEEAGVPDGLAVDDEGFLWSVRWGGGKIIRYDPAGAVEREILVPVPHPTSCAFGGPGRNELFITTCQEALSAEQRRRYPQAGDLFHLQTEVTGQARMRFPG